MTLILPRDAYMRSADYGVTRCPSVRLSHSHTGILSKWLNVSVVTQF